jgi:hypothetical protein
MTKLRRVAERAGRGGGSGVRAKSRLRLYSASPPRAARLLVAAILHPLRRGVLRIRLLVARYGTPGPDLVLGELPSGAPPDIVRVVAGGFTSVRLPLGPFEEPVAIMPS